ncbi:MAG: SH3 domain-containing protein [Lachnospiraceae bacterium]|nr:SH3 domain-containing protein [Lachnospiraceae bacterium]
MVTAGAGAKVEDKKEEEKVNTVSADDISNLTAGSESKVEASEEDGKVSLVDAVTAAEHIDTEDFTNLVIARVNDYVNVRSMPTEDSEVVGKLYNKSVGDQLEDAGDWVKIKSGNTVGYVKKEYVVTGDEAKKLAKEVGTRMAKVITTTLYVRKEASKDSEVIGMVPMDDVLTVSEETDEWIKVSVEEGDGYVSAEFVRLFTDFVRAESKQEEEARLKKEEAEREAARKAAAEAEKKNKKKQSSSSGKSSSSSGKSSSGGSGYSASGSGTGASVANYALQFVGNPYVYGGTSLTNGADCSGFVMSVYRNFGVSLPHSSGGDRSVGSAVQGGLSNAQAGDIVCYSGHVGIYIGNGQIVHASTAKTGIKVSNANYRSVLAVRRIF